MAVGRDDTDDDDDELSSPSVSTILIVFTNEQQLQVVAQQEQNASRVDNDGFPNPFLVEGFVGCCRRGNLREVVLLRDPVDFTSPASTILWSRTRYGTLVCTYPPPA
jgi:hypothetical protein